MLKPLLFILVGLIGLGFSIKHNLDERALEQHGATAQIQPLEEYTRIVRTRHNRSDTSFKADIRFVTASGETITTEKPLSYDQLHLVTSGRPVTVRYLPENPRVNRLEGEKPWSTFGLMVGVLMLVFGAFWFRRVLNSPPEHAR